MAKKKKKGNIFPGTVFVSENYPENAYPSLEELANNVGSDVGYVACYELLHFGKLSVGYDLTDG